MKDKQQDALMALSLAKETGARLTLIRFVAIIDSANKRTDSKRRSKAEKEK
jgi:hypothetical protein